MVRDRHARTLTFVKRLFVFSEPRDRCVSAGLGRVAGHGEDGQPLNAGHHRMVVVAAKVEP